MRGTPAPPTHQPNQPQPQHHHPPTRTTRKETDRLQGGLKGGVLGVVLGVVRLGGVTFAVRAVWVGWVEGWCHW